MNRIVEFTPKFVDLMPGTLDEGIVYVSVPYALTAHLCACGCREKVVLPLHPQQWNFTYDGKCITIDPSVGNIGTPCNSHYWITRGRVHWDRIITAEQAKRRFARDRRDVLRFNEPMEELGRTYAPTLPEGRWRKLVNRFRSR